MTANVMHTSNNNNNSEWKLKMLLFFSSFRFNQTCVSHTGSMRAHRRTVTHFERAYIYTHRQSTRFKVKAIIKFMFIFKIELFKAILKESHSKDGIIPICLVAFESNIILNGAHRLEAATAAAAVAHTKRNRAMRWPKR